MPSYCNSNVCHICQDFTDIRCQNVHDLDRNLLYGPSSNANMPIETPFVTFDELAIAMLAPTVTIYEIFMYAFPLP